jgi:23S rRNA U2552 (ribose-2'-O)-methylase RlmE/FtsJ
MQALRGASQIIALAIETLKKELPPPPPSVNEIRRAGQYYMVDLIFSDVYRLIVLIMMNDNIRSIPACCTIPQLSLSLISYSTMSLMS